MASGVITKSKVDVVELLQITSLSDMETRLNNALASMEENCMTEIVLTIKTAFTGFDTTKYVGVIYKLTSTRAWIEINTAFGQFTIGTRNTSWSWFSVNKTQI